VEGAEIDAGQIRRAPRQCRAGSNAEEQFFDCKPKRSRMKAERDLCSDSRSSGKRRLWPVRQSGDKAVSFGPCTACFLWRKQRKWGVHKSPLHLQGAKQKQAAPAEVQYKMYIPPSGEDINKSKH